MSRDLGLALVPWSPLKNGFLSGKYRRNVQVIDSERVKFVGGPSSGQFDVVAAIADEFGETAAAVSLPWLLQRVGTVVPIIGAHPAPLRGSCGRCCSSPLLQSDVRY